MWFERKDICISFSSHLLNGLYHTYICWEFITSKTFIYSNYFLFSLFSRSKIRSRYIKNIEKPFINASAWIEGFLCFYYLFYIRKGDGILKNRTLLNVIGIFIILISTILFINVLHSSGASFVLIILIIMVGLLLFKFNLL